MAQWLGHAPSMTLDTYGHVIAELSEGERRPAEVEIRLARGELVPATFPRASDG